MKALPETQTQYLTWLYNNRGERVNQRFEGFTAGQVGEGIGKDGLAACAGLRPLVRNGLVFKFNPHNGPVEYSITGEGVTFYAEAG